MRLTAERVAERARIVSQTEQTLGEVKEIFADLAGLVAEQATHIDHISNSIENTARQAETAADELKLAGKYSHQRRQRQMCMYLAAFGFAAAVLLYLMASLRT